jgi:hypothetical protein
MPLPGADDPKDTLVAGVLAFCVPGLGHIYAGSTRFGVFLFVTEVVLFVLSWGLALIAVHVFQIFAAAGAARIWNERRATTAGAGVPPPPGPKAHRTPVPTLEAPDEGGVEGGGARTDEGGEA